MTVLGTLLLALAGFAALSLSMQKHHRDLLGGAPLRARALALKCAGWLLLAASLWTALSGEGVFVGIVLWLGIATIAALTVAMLLTYGARKRAC